jgi:hypothetical protein
MGNKEALEEPAKALHQGDAVRIRARDKSRAQANRESSQGERRHPWCETRKQGERADWMTPLRRLGRAEKLLRTCKVTARPRGLEFAIGLAEIPPAIEAGRCVVTSLPFDVWNLPTGRGARASIASMRRAATCREIPGNVQVVVRMYDAV